MLIKIINLIAALIAAILFFVLMAGVEAKVTGNCVNCHTMHNSQGGTAVVAVGPQGCLLNKEGCVGCHSSTSSTVWKDSVNNAPIVFNTVEPTYAAKGLAGGNFYYVSTTVDNTGHNIFSTNVDGALGNTPPGGTALASQITCAGSTGCHGNRSITGSLGAIKGAHHISDTILKFGASFTETGQGASTGLSYRFLNAVKGGEDTDWQYTSSASEHNEYKGATTFSDTSTISYLCGQCHGNYHSAAGVGSASPWLRHPTDISLPAAGEYTAYTTYNLTAPVARTAIPTASSNGTVTPSGATDDIIMCLSCHRAHASANFKITRWDYKSTALGTALSGCIVCHKGKD